METYFAGTDLYIVWPVVLALFPWQMGSSTAAVILDMLMFLMEAIQTNFQQASAVGSSSRAQQALNELHTQDKNVEMTDQLMVWFKWLGV